MGFFLDIGEQKRDRVVSITHTLQSYDVEIASEKPLQGRARVLDAVFTFVNGSQAIVWYDNEGASSWLQNSPDFAYERFSADYVFEYRRRNDYIEPITFQRNRRQLSEVHFNALRAQAIDCVC